MTTDETLRTEDNAAPTTPTWPPTHGPTEPREHRSESVFRLWLGNAPVPRIGRTTVTGRGLPAAAR